MFVDIVEDFWNFKSADGKLLAMLYDQAKADLRRSAFPEQFIKYVYNSLLGACAAVRTDGGLTHP